MTFLILLFVFKNTQAHT